MSHTEGHLVLIETSGNQRHIFETNKLRENIGASQQLVNVGLHDVLRIVRDLGGPKVVSMEDVCIPDKNPSIESSESTEIEVWYASSGKAMLFVRSLEKGRDIVRALTTHALKAYPGIVVRGAVSRRFTFSVPELFGSEDGRVKGVVGEVHDAVAAKRSRLLPDECRFARLPVVADCRTSGLPASQIISEAKGKDRIAVSAVSAGKRDGELLKGALERMQGLVQQGDDSDPIAIPRDPDKLEAMLGECRYVAVIHADGNGIGKIFESFHKHCGDPPMGKSAHRHVIESLRKFSHGLDRCTQDAFRAAVHETARSHPDFVQRGVNHAEWQVLLLPLIVGGDDLTAICSGAAAIPLVVSFLKQFDEQVFGDDIVGPLALQANKVEKRLGMAAGVAIVKPHYPFFASYSMAESLLATTKQFVKKRVRTRGQGEVPCTAFDFHVHHSASGDDLPEIREELERTVDVVPRGENAKRKTRCRLWGGPWIVTSLADDHQNEFTSRRAWSRLSRRAREIVRRDKYDEGRSVLPSSQLHELRAALFDGPRAIDERLDLIRHRYRDVAWRHVLEAGHGDELSAFWAETPDQEEDERREIKEVRVSSLRDAMALAKLDPRAIEIEDERNAAEEAQP